MSYEGVQASMVWNKRIVALLCLVLAVTTITGCSRETVEVKNVVEAYIKLLPEALSKPNANVMEFFTTPYELGRVDSYISLLKSDKRLMISEIKKLEFLDAKVLPSKSEALVRTRELWKYYYIDEKTRKQITPEEELDYDNTYRLVKEAGHWVVDKVDVQEKAVSTGGKQ
jgi:hypothetical protein